MYLTFQKVIVLELGRMEQVSGIKVISTAETRTAWLLVNNGWSKERGCSAVPPVATCARGFQGVLQDWGSTGFAPLHPAEQPGFLRFSQDGMYTSTCNATGSHRPFWTETKLVFLSLKFFPGLLH